MRREAKRRAYLDNERKEMEKLVDQAFEAIDDPKKGYWAGRVKAHWNRRLKGCTKTRWIEFMAGLNDETAIGSTQQKKMREYLIMARDAANEEIRKQKRGIF